MRGAALRLATAMLVAGAVACGRTNLSDGPAEPPEDASTLDASTGDAAPDANRGHGEASVADSYAAADQGTAAADSAPDASPSLDAAEGPDANTDASPSDSSSDADGASDAGEQHLSCDQCRRGDQQCGALPQVCTSDDAGGFQCELPGQAIWTCIVGDAGCAVWDRGLACRSDVPCCAPCMYAYACPVGAPGNPCEQDTDCEFNACDAVTHECAVEQCADHRQDGQESDVDCGGPLCGACLVGQRCQSSFDCQAGHPCGSSHLCE